ncbi:MAG TPA: hypothetical protein VGJ21_03135 [Terracidiphilus sp.]
MSLRSSRSKRWKNTLVATAAGLCALAASGQDVPLISGGAGLITSTKGGNTTYLPVIAPLLAAPIGSRLLVESRANVLESFSPRGGGQPGYVHDAFLGLTYLQGDFVASRHLTVVGGEFLTPFGTYNERLTPLWISNFEEAPLIFSLGTMGTASSVGGMLRGSLWSNSNANVTYAGYFSAASTNQQFDSERSAGGQGSVYLPRARVEIGASYGRLLQNTHENFAGTHLWWEPADSNLRIRSEYAQGEHGRGYWIEGAYRLARIHSEDSILGRLEPALRMQQSFRNSPDSQDGLPAADTNRIDFALDYHLPHEVRINTSYARELASTGDRNIWQTEIVYRFLIPTWRAK